MDIRCPFCGEPWDHDSLHDMPPGSAYKSSYDRVTDRNPGYERASAAFQTYGCGFFDHTWSGKPLDKCQRRVIDGEAAATATMVYATLGDMDAAASFLDDLS